MKRIEYTLVFEVPSSFDQGQLGMEIEDHMNRLYPELYQDVMWRTRHEPIGGVRLP